MSRNPIRMKRRSTLKFLGMGMGFPAMLGTASVPWFAQAQEPEYFTNPLNIPPLLTGTARGNEKLFALKMAPGESEFFSGIRTATWGINGNYLGPTLRFSRDDLIRLQVDNRVGEPSTLHWHGLHIPPRSDGGPRQIIGHGERWAPLIRVMQKAGTFWYHSHMLHKTGPQVYRGLAGMIIIDDDESRSLALPDQYGVDDVPLILQDRRFEEDGSLQYMTRYEDMVKGMHGDVTLVNGTSSPLFTPTSKRIRFRLLNAANARTFNLAFSDQRSFLQIASDGGFLESPVEMRSLVLAPAERAEIVVDFSDGAPTTLVSLAMDTRFPVFPGALSEIMRSMNAQAFNLLAIRPDANLNASPATPSLLTRLQRPDSGSADRSRQLRLVMGAGPRSGEDRGPGYGGRNGQGGGHGGGHYVINGRAMNIDYINQRVPIGSTEIWEIENVSPMAHPFHIHGGQFRILDRDGKPPAPNEMGLKDTVRVASGQVVRMLVSFKDFADPENTYMYHCHMLEHEDRGMMGQFLVD